MTVESKEVQVQVQVQAQAFQPVCFVLRGLPGTGKTTLANSPIFPNTTKIISVDEYWSEENKFSKEKVNDAFKWCFQNFKQLVQDKVSPIIVDNSNIKKFHYIQYVDYAQRVGYLVVVGILPHNHLSEGEMHERSSKKTSQLTIRKLKEEFEWPL